MLIASILAIPIGSKLRKDVVLARGNATGHRHRHRIEDRRSARLYADGMQLYLEVVADEARVVHPEHEAIVLPGGIYRVWRQREYTEDRPVPVDD